MENKKSLKNIDNKSCRLFKELQFLLVFQDLRYLLLALAHHLPPKGMNK